MPRLQVLFHCYDCEYRITRGWDSAKLCGITHKVLDYSSSRGAPVDNEKLPKFIDHFPENCPLPKTDQLK